MTRALPLAASFVLLASFALEARADSDACDGPPACCPKDSAPRLDQRATVSVGVGFLNVYNVDDKMGSWEADYYLYESWPPGLGFSPHTEIVNEVERKSSQFDETLVQGGRCLRSRRLHSTLHSRYELKRFPFDTQQLQLELADAEYDSSELTYERAPLRLGLDAEARDDLVEWQVAAEPTFTVDTHRASWGTLVTDAPAFDHAVIRIPVKRMMGFYLTRFFLPLLLIVAVALSVFWIHPEDLSSQVGIGVTCLLAVIAFQFAQASSLPQVAYLTLADRVYAICYIAITLALVESVWTNTLVRRGRHDDADRLDRICRAAFPAAIVLLIAASVLL